MFRVIFKHNKKSVN